MKDHEVQLSVRDPKYSYDIIINPSTLESNIDIGPMHKRRRIVSDQPTTARYAFWVGTHRGWAGKGQTHYFTPAYFLTDGQGLVRYTLEYGRQASMAKRIVKAYLNNEINWHEGLLE